MANRKIGIAPSEFEKPLMREMLTFYSDIVTIELTDFLLTVAQPVHLIMCNLLPKCDGPTCFVELGKQIAKMRAEGFDIG